MLETWDEAERKLRRKMRVYPGTISVPARAFDHSQARPQESGQPAKKQSPEQRRYEDARRKAIVSIHGQDLSSEDQIAEAHAQDAVSAKRRKKRAA